MTTQIIIPVSVPGANEAAGSINRAADAVEKLAARLENERNAARGAAAETRVAAQAATELASAEMRADQAMVARARNAIANRRAMADYVPEWARTSSAQSSNRSKLINLGGAASAAASNLGISNPLIGAGFGMAQQFSAQIAAISGPALLAMGGAAAAAAASFFVLKGYADKAAKEFITFLDRLEREGDFRKKYIENKDRIDKKGLGVFNQSSAATLAAVAAGGGNAINVAKGDSERYKIGMDDALALSANSLTGNQKEAAILASKTLGIGVAEAAQRIADGHLMGSPEQIVSMLSGGKYSTKQIKSRAANIASSDFSKLYDLTNSMLAETSRLDYSLMDRAPGGASSLRSETASSNDPSTLARDRINALTNEMRLSTDKSKQDDIMKEITYLKSSIEGQRTVNSAAR